ncbi:hypothetical protein NLJ89_g4473 [Agrocybe chaxingu]|uniref:F-box domain-containing protein n=1 Tax=Agrocybe chaxingu TaxID=84603 RepID=A0A9W8K227_9AGAR|nr:hypothetical protein NLJ89_g4473 [Agrocybe chaxingu]
MELLARQRHELKTKINLHHDPITSHLPLELVSQVFLEYLAMANSGQWEYRPRAHPADYAPSEWFPDPVFGFKTGLRSPQSILRLVCKNWQQIALRTPQLWATLRVDLDMRDPAQVVRRYLELAGSLPMNLCISQTTTDNDDDSDSDAPETASQAGARVQASLLEVMKNNGQRWKSVYLFLPCELAKRFCSRLKLTATVLHTLVVYPITDPDDPGEVIELTKLKSLRCLRYYGLDIESSVDVAWRNLTHYYNWHAWEEELLTVLKLAPRLTHCEAATNQGPWGAADISPLIHRNLRNLQYFAQEQGIILELITLPSLQELIFEWDEFTELKILTDFLLRSNCRLTHLTLRGQYFRTDEKGGKIDMLQVLEHLPTITHLRFCSSTLGEKPHIFNISHLFLTQFWKLAPQDRSSGPWVCPLLQVLEIEGVLQWDFTWIVFLEVLEHRSQALPMLASVQQASRAGKSPLQRVSLRTEHAATSLPPIDRETAFELLAYRKSGLMIEIIDCCKRDHLKAALQHHGLDL